MEVLTKKKNFKISNDVFRKIIKDLKSEIKENKKEIAKLNEVDYEYNKKIVYIDKIIEAIDYFNEKEVCEKETKNLIVAYYGDPCVTVQLCLSALMNCQMLNLVIDDFCLGVNKLIVELYKEILREYRVFDIISFNNYDNRESIEENKEIIDKMYCLGNKNIYTVCKSIKDLEIEYVPFNVIDIYCENENFYELAREIFNCCYEEGIESEIHEDMPFDDTIEMLNEYGENYCSVILTKNEDYMRRFKNEVKSKYIFVNENPFKVNINIIPEIF
ncbi:MAG: hypothetical protein HFJ25_02600 [Clostridia bacterium]|nr:hypothetical protein [Clostridia bacterium]